MADAPARENVFTRRIGPLPMWVWVAIIAVPLLGYGLLKKKPASTTGTGTGSTTDASQIPQFVNQTYTTVVPPSAPTSVTPPGNAPGPPGAHPPLNVQYVPGGYPGGVPAGASAQTAGNAYNYSAAQIQQMGFPNLRGMTAAQAQKALATFSGGAYHIQNVSGNPSGTITSFTPYSTGQVNIGLS